MDAMLTGVDALVLGEESGATTAIASGLTRLGATVARHSGETSGSVDLVVIAVTDPGGLTSAPLMEMDEAEWIRRCEAPLDAVRTALREAHALLSKGGGRIILLVPTAAMTGAAGYAAYSAVGEGARSLAKAVARSWGTQGITVNCLALSKEQLSPGQSGQGVKTRAPAALPTPEIEKDVAGLIATLAIGPAIVTGTTIMVDGGNYMSV